MPAGSVGPGWLSPSGGRADRSGWWPSLASLGPPGPPGLPSVIHLTLSASLTESTPIRGKRLFPHPPTHTLAVPQSPQAPWGLPPGPPPPVSSSPPCPVSVQSLSMSLSVAGGEVQPWWHLSLPGSRKGAAPPQEGVALPMPTQSAGGQVSDHFSDIALVCLQPWFSHL